MVNKKNLQLLNPIEKQKYIHLFSKGKDTYLNIFNGLHMANTVTCKNESRFINNYESLLAQGDLRTQHNTYINLQGITHLIFGG